MYTFTPFPFVVAELKLIEVKCVVKFRNLRTTVPFVTAHLEIRIIQ